MLGFGSESNRVVLFIPRLAALTIPPSFTILAPSLPAPTPTVRYFVPPMIS